MLYQIVDWQRHYENNRSREIKRPDWCAIPNKQDGLGYRRFLRRPCGEAAYGCWVACVLAASKSQHRDGWLTDDGLETGRPWDAEAISLKTGFSMETVEKMLAYATADDIAWIRAAVLPQEGAAKVRRRDDERTNERTNRTGREEKSAPPVLQDGANDGDIAAFLRASHREFAACQDVALVGVLQKYRGIERATIIEAVRDLMLHYAGDADLGLPAPRRLDTYLRGKPKKAATAKTWEATI